MPEFAVDSSRQAMVATGVVSAAQKWVEGADGKRMRSDDQARDEATGMPLWEVEIVRQVESFGRLSTVTAKIQVQSQEEPRPRVFTPITFEGLVVSVRVNKAGALVEYWSAESVKDLTPTAGSASSSSGGSAGQAKAAA